MKTLLLGVILIAGSSFVSKPLPKKVANNYYNVQLQSVQSVGTNFEWTWTVTNPSPGTMQDLSHWSIAIADVVAIGDIVAVSYSADGITWYSLPIALAIDKSQICFGGTVLKFDYGTSGSAPSYYKLTLNKEFALGSTLANFKSGTKTGCYNSTIQGIGLPPDVITE